MKNSRQCARTPGKLQNCLFATIMLWFLASAVLMTGCSGQLHSTRTENLGPFADNTIAIVAEMDFGLTEDMAVYTREYIRIGDPENIAIAERAEAIEQIFRTIVEYSIDVVTLSESDRSESEKVNIYADYLDDFKELVLRKTDMTDKQFQQVMKSIRSQTKLLNAIKEAQPVINAGTRYGLTVITELENLGFDYVLELERRIDDDFGYARNFMEDVEDQKQVALEGIRQLYRYEAGDRSALDELRRSPAIRSKQLVKNNRLSEAEIAAVESQLLDYLGRLNTLGWQLSDDVEYYQETHRELDRIYNAFLLNLSRSRLTLVLWGRAHQKMASGTVASAKWFDITETPALLLKIGAMAL